MSAGEALQLCVEIDRDASPVSGRVAAGHGAERRAFIGWTELFAALQAAIADDHHKEGTRC
jgi:hypothetical protein